MCTACAGVRWFSDYMIKKFMIPKGFFHNSLTAFQYQQILEKAHFSNFKIEMLGALIFAQFINLQV